MRTCQYEVILEPLKYVYASMKWFLNYYETLCMPIWGDIWTHRNRVYASMMWFVNHYKQSMCMPAWSNVLTIINQTLCVPVWSDS